MYVIVYYTVPLAIPSSPSHLTMCNLYTVFSIIICSLALPFLVFTKEQRID